MMILSFLCLKDLCFPVQFVYSNYLGNSFILYLVLLYLEPDVSLLSNISKRSKNNTITLSLPTINLYHYYS